MEQSIVEESMTSEMSVVHAPQQTPSEEDDERQKMIAATVCCIILLLFLLLYFVVTTLFVDDDMTDDTDGPDRGNIYVPLNPGPSGPAPTKASESTTTSTPITTVSPTKLRTSAPPHPPLTRKTKATRMTITTTTTTTTTTTSTSTTTTTTTTYRPSNPKYVKKSISGLICHTVVESYLKFAVPDGCDFFIADVVIAAPVKHPQYSPYMASVNLKNASQKAAVMRRMQLAPGKGLILMVNRSSLRPKNPQARPQAIVRGILQIVTDINADGVGLTDQGLREADVKEVTSDADVLSDEMRDYHGLYRHESYSGSPNVFKSLVQYISTKSSLVFIYRVFGRATYFTTPYFTNFFTAKKNDPPVSDYIKRDIVDPLSQKQGAKAVALSMSLRVRRCAKYSLDGNQQPNCTELPLDFKKICDISPANIECHRYSVMTRRWEGGLNEDLTDIYFFEVEETVSRKARLMAEQLKKAQIQTIAIIVEHYEYDPNETVMAFSPDKQKDVPCAVTPFGITNRTKAQLKKVI